MMKRFIRQKNRNSKTMGVVLLIAVLCLSVVYAALYSVIYMYGTGSVDISYKDLYYWVDTSTGKGNFYTSCTNGTATSSTGITKMSVAVNALKEGGTIHMLSPYSATAEETVSVNSKTVKIQRYVKKGENNKVEYSNEKGPLFNVSANLKFDLVKVGTEAPCLTIDGSEITSDASAFNVLSGGTLTLNNDADGVAQGTFVVTGNYASVSGGAVNLSGGSLVANAVQFTDNRSINTLESYGGAIYASGGSNVTLNNCSFENNTARSSTKVNVQGTIYQKGEHPAYGGAVYSISSTVNMSGCTFTANAADVEGDNGVLASGGAVYIGSQSSGSMKDCTVTNNQTSYNGRTGAGVCVAEGGNSFAFSGKTIIEGNHCYFLRADIDNGLNENDNLHLEGGASNISVDTSKLSAGSKIYITASPSPSENSDFRSLISDKSHKASSTGYFESDVGGYVVQSNTDSDDGGLYLVAGSSYDNLWYGCKTIYQFDKYGKVDGNYFHYGFFGDEALTQDTGFTRLTDAVAALQTGGSIHMLKTYEVSVSETVNMPKNKTVNVVRESTLGGNSMFKLREGTFIINSLEDSSKIIFDGQNLPASTSGGAFSATRNTTGNGGENNFELNGIQKTDGTKSIIIQNNKITGSYNSGAGLYIWSDKSKISNCEIKNNSTEKTGGGIYFSNSMGSYVLENCNVTNNKASENGGGVYLDYGTYAMLGTMNITGNTVNGAANNLYVVNAVGLASGSSSLNTGSQIGLTTSSTPAEGSPVKFASSATEAMKACFTPDVSNYKVKYNSSDNGLYLAVPTYSDLWYKADENDSNTKKFFEGSDVNNLTATDITKFSKAVQRLSASGKIHMLTTYESTENETTTMTAGKNVTVLREGTFNNASMFKITVGTFEIDATDESSSVTFDGQKIETTVDKGGAFYVDTYGEIKLSGAEKTVENKKEKTIVIKDNIISLSSDTSSVKVYGGGVYIYSNGTNTLTNCSITGNKVSASSTTKSTNAYGGGVYIDYGTDTLTNCSITENKASATITNTAANASANAYGGGVYIHNGANTLTNCSITGNTASSKYAYGGGVCIDYGTNTLENCSITENKAESSHSAEGGGVYIDGGTNTLTNCSITGNTASSTSSYAYGGGVCIPSNLGTNTLTNCSITENKASSSSFAYGGGVYISENTTLLGTTNITGNTAEKGSDSSESNLYLDGDKTVALSDSNGGKLSAGSQIGVTTRRNPTSGTDRKFATNATEDEMMNYFTSDKGYTVCKQGTELYLTLAPSELYQSDNKFYLDAEKTKLTNIKTMAEAVKTATTVHMLSAYTASSNETVEVPSGKDVTVIRDDNFTNASMFKITGGTFEVRATDASSSITFDGNNITPTAEYKGGAFNVYQGSATFKLSGAEKSDGVNKTIVIKNNIVTGTDCWGGGIYCRKTTNVISNCNIINNSAEYGGAVYFDFGTNTVSNCTITDNKSTNLGAGITFWQGTNLMTDTMKITGNKTSGGANSNVFFNSSTVSLADSSSNKQLSTSSQIGVTTSPEPTAGTDVQFATNATAEMQACFTHDPGTSEVVYKDGGLYLSASTRLYYSTTSGSGLFYKDEACTESTGLTKLTDAVGSIASKGEIYMMSQYASSADEETNVTAGKSIKVIRHKSFTTDSMFKITGGTFKVNATDPTSSITFDGQKITSTANYDGGAFYVDTNGSINFNGADKSGGGKTITIQNNIISYSSYARGGGVYIFSGTNTLTNCSITGNTSYSSSSYTRGGGIYIRSGTNMLTNCSITGNTASSASAYAYGGGVCINAGTNTLTNCSITGNTASSASAYGGGVYISSGTNTLLGNMNITGNTAVVGSDSSEGNLYLNSGYTGALSDSNGNKLSTSSQIGILTGKTPTEGTDVQFATNATEEMKACFTDDRDTSGVIYKDSGLYLRYATKLYYKEGKFYSDEACTTATSYTKLSDAVGSISSVGKIYMMSQYASSADETVSVTGGKSIEVIRYKNFTDASMFSITGGTFTVNADASSLITFDGKKITPTAAYNGGAFNVNGGNIKLSGAKVNDDLRTIIIRNNVISSDSASVCGGAIYANGGTNTLSSCSVTGNTASSTSTSKHSYGGGIYLNSGTNSISDCSITQNTAAYATNGDYSAYGGGVYIGTGTNTFSSCSVTGNTASTTSTSSASSAYGAGVYISGSGPNTLLGTMNITGNKKVTSSASSENNLYFFTDRTVALSDASNNTLSTDSKVGVLTRDKPAAGKEVQFATKATEDMADCFTADNGQSEALYKDGGLYLGISTTLYYKSGKFYTDEACTNATDYTKLSEAVGSIDSNGKIYMMSQYASSADEETNVTAGKNIQVIRYKDFKDASMFKITGGTFKVNATDASSSITFDGNKIETTVYRGGAFYVDGGSIKLSGAEKTVENEKVKTIVIKDNIISRSSDSDVSADGGGVYLGGGGTNTLSNCSITGNTVSCNSTTTSYASGGGVCIYSGTNTLTNCSITGNKAYASSDTKSAFAYGGGVYTIGEKNTLSNCSITENTASSTSSASYYSPASVDAYGGGVCIWDGTNTLTNCSITGNTASSSASSCNAYGGGVFNYKNATLLGTTNITGNTVKKRSDSSDNNLHLMNKYTVALSNSSGGALSADSHIGVTSKASLPVQFATNATEEMKACFTADYSDYYVSYKDSGLYLNYVQKLYYKSKKFYTDEACTNATSYTKLSEAVNSIDSNGKIYMMSSYSSSSNEETNVTAGKNIRVIRHKDFKDNSMFRITGGTFKVNATDPTSAITFDGNNITTSINEGGAFYVEGGSINFKGADKSGGGKTIAIQNNVAFSSSSIALGGGVYLGGSGTNTLSNCSITGNTASSTSSSSASASAYGGGVYITGSGTNTLENCSITGNTASSSTYTSYGGGVCIHSGTNTLTNCSITGNKAESSYAYGGGVCIWDGTNTLENCSITGNTASSSAYGGGVYIIGGTNTLENCSITGNTASSSSSAYGGGVYIDGGTNTLLGTMNITGNTVKKESYSSDNNLYFKKNYTVALSNSSGGTLSTSSQIGVTTKTAPTSSTPVKFATGVTDDIAAVRFCFDDDKKANEVYRIGTELYLGKDSSVTYEKYDNLYYYRTTTGDNNDGLFYTDSSHSNSTGIKLLSEAVGHLNKGGNIYFMSSYTTSTTGERVVAPPDMGEIHIIRYSSPSTTFDGESMININGLFEVTCPHTNSTIIFDGNNVSTKNTGAGILWLWQTGSARIIGASPSCKNIKFVNSIITTGGGAAIRLGGGDNVIKNCIIEGNKRTSTDSEGSGAVLLLEDGGHANSTSMENCDLINNTSAGNAGALYVASGTHSFTNCNITNNQGFGGGSYINGGTNSFTGCKISNNTSVKVGSIEPYGGGLYINKGTNYFLNCEINGNKAHNGGGLISKSATNTFEKCTVSGNVIDDYGNGLCLDGSSNTIIDCTITDNKGASHGAGIWVGGGTVNIYGNTVVKNNVLNDGTTENNLEVAGGCTVALSDGSGNALSTSSNIGVTTNTAPTVDTPVQFATSATEEMKACFTPDEAKRYVTYEDGKLYLRYGYVDLYYKNGTFYTDEACSSSSGLTKFSEAVSNIALKGGTIHMMSQYASSADETVTVLAGANITVARHKDFKDASMFKITGGTFKVNATDATSSITFDGNKIKTTVEKGGAFYVLGDSTKFTLNGAEKSGGGKTITIQNNAVITQGGGIYLNGNGTHTLTNCSITKNTASSSGGGIYLNSNGTCTLLGTMNITGNTANNGSDSSDNNLHLGGRFKITLSDGSGNALSTSSKIGVTTATAPTEGTDVQFATGATSAMASCFTPDDSSYNVAYGSSGTLSLVVDNQKQITLSSSTPSIRITPEGYYTPQNSTTLNSFTGTYVLTGSYKGTSSSKNPDVVFENTSTERKTIKVKIKNLSLKAYDWCSLGLLKGNGPMDIYITAEGTNSLQGYNHPAFNTNSDKVQGSNMYLNVKSGSTLLGSTNKEAPSRVAADGINFYFNGTLLTSEQKNKNTKFTSTGYTQ